MLYTRTLKTAAATVQMGQIPCAVAAFYSLFEMGVSKDKIQLWLHNLDGGHPSRPMDWPVGEIITAPISVRQEESEALRRRIMESAADAALPEDSAALSRLWCSQYEELLLDEMLSYDLQDLGRSEYVGEHPKSKPGVVGNLHQLEQLDNIGKLFAKSGIKNGRWYSCRCKKEDPRKGASEWGAVKTMSVTR